MPLWEDLHKHLVHHAKRGSAVLFLHFCSISLIASVQNSGHISADHLQYIWREKRETTLLTKTALVLQAQVSVLEWNRSSAHEAMIRRVNQSRDCSAFRPTASRIPRLKQCSLRNDQTLTWLSLLHAHDHSSVHKNFWYGGKTFSYKLLNCPTMKIKESRKNKHEK